MQIEREVDPSDDRIDEVVLSRVHEGERHRRGVDVHEPASGILDAPPDRGRAEGRPRGVQRGDRRVRVADELALVDQRGRGVDVDDLPPTPSRAHHMADLADLARVPRWRSRDEGVRHAAEEAEHEEAAREPAPLLAVRGVQDARDDERQDEVARVDDARGGVPPAGLRFEEVLLQPHRGHVPETDDAIDVGLRSDLDRGVDEPGRAAGEVVQRHPDDEDRPVEQHAGQRPPRTADAHDEHPADDPKQETLAVERDAGAAHEPHEHAEVRKEGSPSDDGPRADAPRGRALRRPPRPRAEGWRC